MTMKTDNGGALAAVGEFLLAALACAILFGLAWFFCMATPPQSSAVNDMEVEEG